MLQQHAVQPWRAVTTAIWRPLMISTALALFSLIVALTGTCALAQRAPAGDRAMGAGRPSFANAADRADRAAPTDRAPAADRAPAGDKPSAGAGDRGTGSQSDGGSQRDPAGAASERMVEGRAAARQVIETQGNSGCPDCQPAAQRKQMRLNNQDCRLPRYSGNSFDAGNISGPTRCDRPEH